MKHLLKKGIILSIFAALIFLSCSKKEPLIANSGITLPTPVPSPAAPPTITAITCENRPVINARLVPIGSLSQGRIGLVSATAGSKIVFAGGMIVGAYSSRVDIYDTASKTWSTAELSRAERQGMAIAAVGNKVLFAGGGDNDNGTVTSRVDIYDVAANSWSQVELSQARSYLAAITIYNKIYFAGGGTWGPIVGGSPNPNWPSNANYYVGSNAVDIYDNTTNTWTIATLSEGRFELSATVIGNKIYFAGGFQSIFNVSNRIDIFDTQTNAWSTSQLQEFRGSHASAAVGNKIFWAGGANNPYWSGFNLSKQVEIKDVITNVSSFVCITPKSQFNAVIKDGNIVFFTGNTGSGIQFEIYNPSTNQWSTGILNKQINDATIISVNNTIYVAGGRDQPWGPYFNQVWKLEF
jgi:Kelch motif/Galactose oxidase, central domain